MNSNYVIWQYKSVEGACVLQDLKGLEQTFRLNNGAPLAADFPGDVAYHMHRDFPDDLLLTDNLLNTGTELVVSARLKSAIEALGVVHVEFLPVKIVDHRERTASADYFILHPLDPVARIDEQASDFKMNMIKKGHIQSFNRLVLDESSIPQDRSIFHLHNFSRIALVRRATADALTAQGFSGLGWLEISDYPAK